MFRRVCAALALGLIALASCTTFEVPSKEAPGRIAQGWNAATAPIHIRQNHTATLLGTGDILIAGGGAVPDSTEIFELGRGRTVVGPTLLTARSGHTATMLTSGKVLLAGGDATGSAELYDPIARTTTATGALTKKRSSHLAVRLRSGKVLVVGGANDTSTELYDPATGTWSAGPNRIGRGAASMTTLADGRVLVGSLVTTGVPMEVYDPNDATTPWRQISAPLGAQTIIASTTRLSTGQVVLGLHLGCASVGGPPQCNDDIRTYDPSSGFGNEISMPTGRDQISAVRLVDDRVAFLGGFPTAVDVYSALAGSAASDGALSTAYGLPTTTLVPGGDVFVVGGTQASIDQRVATGTWSSSSTFALGKGRLRHAAVRLHDGKVLVSGGTDTFAPAAFSDAEIVDPIARTVTAAPNAMTTARVDHSMTALRDGTVLVAGGGTAAADLYTPGTGFAALPPMTTARSGHAAVLLPSGKVLLLGGDSAGTAELYDPAAKTFSALPLPATTHDGSAKRAVLMPNGSVLVVGGAQAEVFDPLTATFHTVAAPGASRDGTTARLLVTGKVFVSGGATLAADLFDPTTETWSFSGALPDLYASRQWSSLADGRLLGAGGRLDIDGVSNAARIFDPLGVATGTFAAAPNMTLDAGYQNTYTLAGDGEILSIGGTSCYGACVGFANKVVDRFSDGAAGARPAITNVPASVVAGTRVTITGTGFANGSESASGSTGSSATNHPLAYWVSDANDGVVRGTILDFTDTTATWLVPATALYGHGQLFVGASGVMSHGASVTIEPAHAATGCENDAQCATGFCVDGVCCDRRCDGACEGCSAAHKLSGDDGVCGAVPPGQDIYGRCILKLGEACTKKEECGPNFCSPQGVCCDSACDGQCLSCNLSGKAGTCSAINEGACGAACDGAHTLKQVGAPDHDCAPFNCEGTQCKTTCASVKDCAAPAVCSLAGQCVPPVASTADDKSIFGCAMTPAPSAPCWPLALAVVPLLRRRRRR